MLEIKDLDFAYRKNMLFNKLSLKLEAGSITGLLGKNGAGKTTLLKILSGLLFSQSGSISVIGHNPKQREASFLAQVFLVPEEFHVPAISGARFIKANAPFYPNFDHVLMEKLLGEFELSEDRSLHKLSYGQKKKFLISFALATKCKFLVLDEPTNGLDIPSKAIFRKVMAGSLEEDQLVLISTHQVKDVENLIDKIIIISDGHVLLEKDMHEITSQLQFANASTAEGEHILYSEMVPGGYRTIQKQLNGSSLVDIELLFNAITRGTPLFRNEE